MDDPRANIMLQRYVNRYLQELGPVLNQGRYYLQFLVRCYVVMGPDITTAELLRQAAERYGRTAGSIRACVGRFTKNVCKGEFKDLLIRRWRELGWDGETELTPAVAIPLVCRGFQPYMAERYPQEYREMMAQLLPSVTYPAQYMDRLQAEVEEAKAQLAAGELRVFDNVDELFQYLEDGSPDPLLPPEEQGQTPDAPHGR